MQTEQGCPSLVGIEPTMYCQHTTESAHYPTMPLKHKKKERDERENNTICV